MASLCESRAGEESTRERNVRYSGAFDSPARADRIAGLRGKRCRAQRRRGAARRGHLIVKPPVDAPSRALGRGRAHARRTTAARGCGGKNVRESIQRRGESGATRARYHAEAEIGKGGHYFFSRIPYHRTAANDEKEYHPRSLSRCNRRLLHALTATAQPPLKRRQPQVFLFRANLVAVGQVCIISTVPSLSYARTEARVVATVATSNRNDGV